MPPFALDGGVDRLAFETDVACVLVPEVRSGDVVIVDDLPAHEGPRETALIEAAGARSPHLPRLPSRLRRQRERLRRDRGLVEQGVERTVADSWTAIGRPVDLITSAECADTSAAAGHDAT